MVRFYSATDLFWDSIPSWKVQGAIGARAAGMLNTLYFDAFTQIVPFRATQFPQQEATQCEHPFAGNQQAQNLLFPRSQEGSRPQDHFPILTTSRSAANKHENPHLPGCAEVTQTSKQQLLLRHCHSQPRILTISPRFSCLLTGGFRVKAGPVSWGLEEQI